MERLGRVLRGRQPDLAEPVDRQFRAHRVPGGARPSAHWFERNRAARGPAGLYTEEYDVHQRQLRGNLPQAFVHAGLLETAARISARS